ncbi:hypothetical protein MSG_02202 [Mycobacterium shigaense]|uniref:Uncharacterized protein n=1 Tax=Mycobacterium shigaense TaxID=722731 RepID=A0A1Z4EHB7_9MYCO|nr:hypothetical protein MSG_02202 [Mycobacterium shigaense]
MVYSSGPGAALTERCAFEVPVFQQACDVRHIRCNVNVSRPIV